MPSLDKIMPKLVWMVLQDGRSVVAGCGAATHEELTSAIAAPGVTLTLTSDDAVDRIAAAEVRDFVVFDARSPIPSASAIYRLVHV